jgi:drug/metabolite transporter (DMT)-like permease
MCAPLLVAALAVPLLGERVARVQWIAIAVGLAGVLLMLAPRGGQWASLGALAAVIAAVTYSVAVVSLRLLSRTDTTESMVFWFTALLTLGAGLLDPGWEPLLQDHFWLLVGVGISGALGQHFITEAFRHAPAAVVTPFEYTALLWGVALDFAIWRVLPGTVTLVGGALVIGAGLYIIQRERRTAVRAAGTP